MNENVNEIVPNDILLYSWDLSSRIIIRLLSTICGSRYKHPQPNIRWNSTEEGYDAWQEQEGQRTLGGQGPTKTDSSKHDSWVLTETEGATTKPTQGSRPSAYMLWFFGLYFCWILKIGVKVSLNVYFSIHASFVMICFQYLQ